MARVLQARARMGPTRETIVKAAEAVFTENGFAAARLEDVAARVGIRRPSIVYYFHSKRDIYEAVLDDVFGGLLERIRAAISTPASLPERIEAVVRAWVAYIGARPSLARILLREVAEASPARSPSVVRHVEPVIAAVEQVIREGQRAGIFASIDPMHFIFTVAGGTVFLVSATPPLAPKWPFDPLSRDQLRAHEREILEMTRRWLGIRGPRLAKRTTRRVAR